VISGMTTTANNEVLVTKLLVSPTDMQALKDQGTPLGSGGIIGTG